MSSPPNRKALYKDLTSSTSIRLLKIEHLSTSTSYTLREYDLKECPSFAALSYTWGPAYGNVDEDQPTLTYPASIFCDGFGVPVTENLSDALYQLSRVPDVALVWIDALCINQSDLQERSQQVLLMSKIYSKAKEVIIWLGKPNVDFVYFYLVVTALVQKLADLAQTTSWDQIIASSLYDPTFAGDLDIETLLLTHIFLGYGAFHDTNRWFVRTWIVQEVVNASQIRVLCGNVEISWENIVLMSKIVTAAGWVHMARWTERPEPLPIELETGAIAVYHFQSLRATCMAIKVSGLPTTEVDLLDRQFGSRSQTTRGFAWLFRAISALRHTKCQDPRDKVYAALNIAGYLLPIDSAHLGSIRPDYAAENSAEDVFINVAKVILQNSRSINYLSLAEPGPIISHARLPTWVPDFNSKIYASPLLYFRGFPTFDASLSRDSNDFHCSITGKTLILSGACFDKIEEVCSLSTQDLMGTYAIHLMLDLCCSLPELVRNESRVETLWRTLVGDTALDGNIPAPTSWGLGFKNFVTLCCGIHIAKVEDRGEDTKAAIASISQVLYNMSSESELPSLNEALELYHSLKLPNPGTLQMDKIAKFDRDAAPFLLELRSLAGRRRLFRTRLGALGLGLESCRQGDQIWLIKNSHTPLVLRPAGIDANTFELVGDCYLHGFMRGEMLDKRWGLKEKIRPVTLV